MGDFQSVESLVEERGIEGAVATVLSSISDLSKDERTTRILALEQACGVDFGEDETKWQNWLSRLHAEGAVGFGPLSEDARFPFPASGDTLKDVIEESVINPPEKPQMPAQSPKQTPAHTIGNYELLEKLGEGGMGAVYKARQITMDRIVALKLLPQRLAENEEFTARFMREARVAAKLDHVNIVRGIDVGCEDNTYYFAMEYVRGGSVNDLMKLQGRISEQRSIRIAIQIARALDHAWEFKLIHRDIKPDNLLVTEDDVAKLADLGLARSTTLDSTMMTQTGVAVGTPHYMSPEQTRGEKTIDIRTDIYSLGATLYHMVTGQTPFTGSTPAVVLTKHLTEPVVPAHIRFPDVSPALSRVIAKMMSKKAADRYATPRELMEDLELVADGRDPVHATARAEVVVTDASGKVSLIGVQELLQMQQSQMTPAPAEVRKSWVPMALGIGAVVIAAVVGLIMALAPDKALEREAGVELLQIEGLVDEGKLKNALGRAKLGAVNYADTASADKFNEKVSSITEMIQQWDEDKAFNEAIARADAAAERKDLIATLHYLKEAVAIRDDPDARKRMNGIENTIVARQLLKDAEALETERKLKEALSKYKAALPVAQEGDLEKATAGVERLKGLIEIEDAVASVAKLIEEKSWRDAWHAGKAAQTRGIDDARLAAYTKQAAAGLLPPKTRLGPLGMELVLVPGGTFTMGSDHEDDEKPIREVTVSPFYIGRYEVTRAQYEAFTRKLKTQPKELDAGAREPVVKVSYSDATNFTQYLESLSDERVPYRLPKEAEWEYAARGTEGRVYPWGSDKPTVEHANLGGVADGFERTAPVGHFKPGATPLGICDMTGNVAEWCADWYGAHYASKSCKDPSGPPEGADRVVRGSAFAYTAAEWSRAAMRGLAKPSAQEDTIGFRVVRELTEEEATFLRAANGG